MSTVVLLVVGLALGLAWFAACIFLFGNGREDLKIVFYGVRAAVLAPGNFLKSVMQAYRYLRSGGREI